MGTESLGIMALKLKTKTKSIAKRKSPELAPNAFVGRDTQPTGAELVSVLGDSYPLWQKLVSELKQEAQIDAADWHTSSTKYGWSLRLQAKKRNIVYLGPRQGWFLAAFALGDKALAAAKVSDLPAPVLRLISQAKRYPEGTAVRIEVRTADDVNTVKILAKIKIDN